MVTIKKRYSDEDLEEFRLLINEKLDAARKLYDDVQKQLRHEGENTDSDTAPTFKALEEGSYSQSKEELMQFAYQQQKYITGLENALIRIQNKTYGIDRLTGELIPKERLRLVPHATLSVASKNALKK